MRRYNMNSTVLYNIMSIIFTYSTHTQYACHQIEIYTYNLVFTNLLGRYVYKNNVPT